MVTEAALVAGSLRVLVVEDNPADMRLMREELRDVPYLSHELTHVASLEAATDRLTEAESQAIDVVVLDLSLPDATGLDGLRRITAVAPQTPVVVLTGLDDESLALQAVREGAQDYLVKGQINGALIARSLRYAFERKRAEQSAQREQEAALTAQIRERFVGILGHDLRNPLNTIVFSAATLSNAATLGDQDRQAVQRIARSAGRMSRMIDDVLDFTRARLGGGFQLHLEPCDLERICRHVIDEFASASDRTIRFEVNGRHPHVPCDPDRIAQVVSNLVSNALRYGAPGTPVSVRLRLQDDGMVLAVTNQGAAIPEDILPTLFDPFRRGSPATKGDGQREGLGLGLYIVEQIAQAHGGRVEVTSTAMGGTTFSLVLPPSHAPDEASAG